MLNDISERFLEGEFKKVVEFFLKLIPELPNPPIGFVLRGYSVSLPGQIYNTEKDLTLNLLIKLLGRGMLNHRLFAFCDTLYGHKVSCDL